MKKQPIAIHINKTGRTLFEKAADALIGDARQMNCEIVMRLRPTKTKAKDTCEIYDQDGRPFVTPPKRLRDRLGIDGSSLTFALRGHFLARSRRIRNVFNAGCSEMAWVKT